MKQFRKIFQFELFYYLKNKIFIGITLLMILLIGIIMFVPRVFGGGDTPDDPTAPDSRPILLVKPQSNDSAQSGWNALVQGTFAQIFEDYRIGVTDEPVDEIRHKVTEEEVAGAFVMESATSFTYYVNNLSIYDANLAMAQSALQELYRVQALLNSGLDPEQVENVMNVPITGNVENLGVDQTRNFFYAYIMLFALYMVILMYGQMIATNVASEKSSRAMELLITSAKPVNMMFGKVMASCAAGFLQLFTVFGSALLFFNLNKSYWNDTPMMQSIFDIPLSLLGYMLLFFVLGFLIYAFLYGAIGSTASKLEDVNTAVMPVTLLYIVATMVVIFNFAGGQVDNTLMKVLSFVPFSSPLAMFARIAMSTVPWYEIVISVGLLAVSVVGIGILAAKIYRVGVLLYGNRPKLRDIFRMLRKA